MLCPQFHIISASRKKRAKKEKKSKKSKKKKGKKGNKKRARTDSSSNGDSADSDLDSGDCSGEATEGSDSSRLGIVSVRFFTILRARNYILNSLISFFFLPPFLFCWPFC